MVKVSMTLDLPTIRSAHERIRPHIHRTLVLTSSRLDQASRASLFFKCENFQKIGAFKARGATNAVFSLDDATARRGVATHSSGNHGAAVARAAKLRGIPAHIVMPSNSAKEVFAEPFPLTFDVPRAARARGSLTSLSRTVAEPPGAIDRR